MRYRFVTGELKVTLQLTFALYASAWTTPTGAAEKSAPEKFWVCSTSKTPLENPVVLKETPLSEPDVSVSQLAAI